MHKRKGSTCHTLGEMLRAARQARRLTLREVAAASAVVHGFIADVEQGRRNASDEVLERIAKAIGVDPRILLRASALERLRKLEQRVEEARRATR